MTSEVKLKTGGDPRSLPDYAALRDEISKLTHPARPDVDWRYVETLCLRLYEHNGVELQTASWYTIARMHTTGLSGLNEGLALIVALTRHHWSVMWPLNTHARLEIITGLFSRLQKTLRAMPPDDRDNLPLLYQTETFLKALSDTLARHELKQSSNPRVQEMVDNWQKSVRSCALPEEAMTGWNEGMTRLQQLAERLNRLDEQRGKYMTVSELKTEVFGIMQAFNRHIPAEEQLRRYDEARNQNGSEQQQKQAEMALNQLINRYQVEHAGKPERLP